MAAAVCTGCPTLFSPVAGGTAEGSVLFAGRAAAGKVVTLQRQTETGLSTVAGPDGGAIDARTSATGVYRFTGLAPGDYRIIFVSGPVPDGQGTPRSRAEVGSWTSRLRAITAAEGARFPPFDIQYNGPIYPIDSSSAYLIAKDFPIPFHWSTHRLGQRYRLKVFAGPSGKGGDLLTADWTSPPTTLVARDVPTGKYSWSVVIDAGEAGEGASMPQEVDLQAPKTAESK